MHLDNFTIGMYYDARSYEWRYFYKYTPSILFKICFKF